MTVRLGFLSWNPSLSHAEDLVFDASVLAAAVVVVVVACGWHAEGSSK